MYPSQALAECIIDSLIAGGVRDFVYCPGSRNAPFAYALSRYDSLSESPIFFISGFSSTFAWMNARLRFLPSDSRWGKAVAPRPRVPA